MDFKTQLEKVILEAGTLALEHYELGKELKYTRKSSKDLVTEADVKVEEFLKNRLLDLFPKIGFFGEESGKSGDSGDIWIVDPIDGTHSFFRGQYYWSISIALQLEGELRLGAVYAPALNDLYLGEKGKGAFRNKKPIKVSTINSLEEAMVCTGFACLRANLEKNNLERFSRVALKTRDQRRLGSAALEISMVGSGHLDAFWEQHLNLYDVAAGSVIAEEAGASICNFSGEKGLNPGEILVTNGLLEDALVELM